MKYISFETAKEYLHKACEGLGSNGGLMLKIKFDQEPTVDINTGKWMYKEKEIYCSKCNFRFYPVMFKYCPGCGAKMEVTK